MLLLAAVGFLFAYIFLVNFPLSYKVLYREDK